MWCTYLITFTLLGYHVQGAALIENNGNPKSITSRLASVIQAKCSKNADQIKYQEVLNALHNLQGCWNRIIPALTKSPQANIEECRENVPGVVECLTEFADKLEPCLEPNEHFLKQFILDGYQKYSDYFCWHINEISFSEPMITNTQQCITQFRQNPNKNPHAVCYDKSDVFGDDASVNVLTKSELCQDLNNIRSCYEELFDKHCPEAPEIKGFQLGFMKAGLDHCSEE